MEERSTAAHIPSVYIPADRRQAIAENRTLPDQTNGAALFADVSGFTALTEALARLYGPKRGAEELTRQLNRVYNALIAEVNHHGGSVIGFAGDAITCWFDASKGTSKLATLRATLCATAMQTAMEAFKTVQLPQGETASLAVKAAIASGPARRFLVGDAEIQLIDALAGETLVRMASAEHLAGRGEIIVDTPTIDRLGDQVIVLEWRAEDTEDAERFAVIAPLEVSAPDLDTFGRLSTQALPDAAVKPWLLPAVYEGLSKGVGESLELRRGVVALFLRFQGIDYDHDAQGGEKLNQYICWVQSIIHQYDGALLQLIIGDKGNYLYATFGAPLAHENDPQRAVSAALDLLKPPPDLNFIAPIQIGVGQGTMRTGAYGGHTRRTYGVIGDAVNLSARLMQNAIPGQALVSKHVQQAAAQDFRWKMLGAIKVKGKSKPVPVASPLGKTQRTRAATYTGELVGREHELNQLQTALAPIFENKFGGVLYIYGEAGVGKSRLVHELRVRIMMEHGVSWFTCPAEPILRQSLNPFKYFLRQYFGQNAENSDEMNKANFKELLQTLEGGLKTSNLPESGALVAELERTRSMLGALVDLHWEDSLYEQLEPELRFRNTLTAFKTLIQAESLRQPVILHVEDGHWLDEGSYELLNTLIQNADLYPFAVLLSGRYQDDGSPFHVQSPANVPEQAFDLNTLSPEGSQALAEQILGGAISASLAEFIAQKTQGNPLFVEQLTLDLRERDLVHMKNGGWTVASHEIETIPASINAVLIARLDRLAAQVKAVVQTAAVLGREFEVQILSRILQNDVDLPEKVHQAEAKMIWLALSELRYIFRHTMMRDAAYDMQLQARLRELHALAAEAMEQLYASELGPHYADLAYHYGKAEEAEREFRYARLAGEYAASQYANQEAVQHYHHALRSLAHFDATQSLAQQQSIYVALGELETTTGQYEEAYGHLQEALEISQQRTDTAGQVHICRWIAQMYEQRGEYPEALEWIQKGLTLLEGQETSDTAELRLIAGLIHTRRGNYDEAMTQFQSALSIAQQLEETTALARAYNGLGLVHLRDNTNTAIENFQQAFALYKQVGAIPGQAMSHNLLANAYFDTGEWHDADYHYRRAREIFEQIGDIYHAAFADNNLGEIALYQGRLDEALSFYQETLREMEQIGGSAYVLGVVHMNLGHVFIRRSEIDMARQELNTARDYFEQAEARDFLPELCRHNAEANLKTADFADAQQQAEYALNLARELEMRGEEGYILRVLGEIYAAQDNFDVSETHLKHSLDILEEMGDDYQQAQTQLALAQLYTQYQHSHDAQQTLRQCIPIFERLGAAVDLQAAQSLLASLKMDEV